MNKIWIDEAVCRKLLDELLTTRWSQMSNQSKDGVILMISTPSGNHWITRNDNKYRGFTYLFQNTLGLNGRYYIPELDRSFDNGEEAREFIDYFYEYNKLARVLYE